MDWINDQWWGLVHAVVNLRAVHKSSEIIDYPVTIFISRTLLHERLHVG